MRRKTYNSKKVIKTFQEDMQLFDSLKYTLISFSASSSHGGEGGPPRDMASKRLQQTQAQVDEVRTIVKL